ncbi:hypothetical protein ACYT32_00200 [Companilactobacillus sp. FL22-3]
MVHCRHPLQFWGIWNVVGRLGAPQQADGLQARPFTKLAKTAN